MVEVEVIPTEELGNRSYIAHDGSSAVVIDPQRDLDRVEAVLSWLGVTCGLVMETHIHNDYVTGGYELARRLGVPYVLSADEDVSFGRHGVRDGQRLAVGRLTVQVTATPGHTDNHLSYVISDGDGPPVVFTGGSLLYGSVGRTDLVDPARTEELTRAQYRSAHRLADALPDDTGVYPTHGFGSFCSSGSAGSAGAGAAASAGAVSHAHAHVHSHAPSPSLSPDPAPDPATAPAAPPSATIGDERARNAALTEPDEDVFVARLVAGLTAYPAYYAHMAALNRQGPGVPDLAPPARVDAHELAKRIADGEWVVDLRDRTAYAAGHLAGTVGIELGRQFATYLGWLLPWGSQLTLIGETPEQVADAQRQLIRIGVDLLAGAGTAPGTLPGEALRSYPRVRFADLAVRPEGEPVMDVRRDDERAQGHIPGSTHVPLHSLLDRLAELPAGRLWVHCAGGFRASIAAALLDRAGRQVVLVDDDYAKAVETGLATG
ncbi:MBL fold metallo-hydrolase [Streptomyces sp. H27-D2]|uniref:MBL fold metallo-hydrolase n=1 Tax=Streptomyces sp. H27-D2 TaxID=3046304 RepID=UPI002DBFB044|nr:rhodanese-like domain-containing protein [Streptomyces sp. H27-D2]MEC4015279.1 rhodanese-like domain-containing protein [Streptomyces sp. H27-D2]